MGGKVLAGGMGPPRAGARSRLGKGEVGSGGRKRIGEERKPKQGDAKKRRGEKDLQPHFSKFNILLQHPGIPFLIIIQFTNSSV